MHSRSFRLSIVLAAAALAMAACNKKGPYAAPAAAQNDPGQTPMGDNGNNNGNNGKDDNDGDEAKPVVQGNDDVLRKGRDIFRFDTFGDEAFWTGVLRMQEPISTVSPRTALAVGLKVDIDALPKGVVDALKAGQVNLDDPAVTTALLQANAVLGVKGTVDASGKLASIGITCALCHSRVDDSFAPGIGHRLDGWSNQDLNVGAIVGLSPNLQAIADLLSKGGTPVDAATVKQVLDSWGPGRYDAELLLDGKAFRPDGASASTVIPPAFGLAGVNLHTYTGWGSVPYWNAFVANTQMHGIGTFYDPRLDDATKFPVAAAVGFGHVKPPDGQEDHISSKLPALHAYQLAIQAPKPPDGSFDAAAAARGKTLFEGKARCATCHTSPTRTEPGWNMHTAEEIAIDDFQAKRSPDERYRTTPLRGLWTHQKRGFYHDGRFPTLVDVINHYDSTGVGNGGQPLGLSDQEKADIAEYLKSE